MPGRAGESALSTRAEAALEMYRRLDPGRRLEAHHGSPLLAVFSLTNFIEG